MEGSLRFQKARLPTDASNERKVRARLDPPRNCVLTPSKSMSIYILCFIVPMREVALAARGDML